MPKGIVQWPARWPPRGVQSSSPSLAGRDVKGVKVMRRGRDTDKGGEEEEEPKRARRSDGEDARASALHRACIDGDEETVRQLVVEEGTSVESPLDSLSRVRPLHRAARRGNLRIVRLLLEEGADANAGDDVRNSPLHYARNEAVTRALLRGGAQVNAPDVNENTPLLVACASSDAGVVRALVEEGGQEAVNAMNRHHDTALHLTASEGIARVLVEGGADINAVNADLDTPLHYASEGVARVLVHRGVDVNAINDHLDSPLHTAVDERVAQVLVEGGAEVNAVNTDRDTPLHLSRDGEVARVLVRGGADVLALNSSHLTPLHMAAARAVCRGPEEDQVVTALVEEGVGGPSWEGWFDACCDWHCD